MFTAVVALAAIFWGIVYKLFLAFTPPWLDIATIVATGCALLVLWALGKGENGHQHLDH